MCLARGGRSSNCPPLSPGMSSTSSCGNLGFCLSLCLLCHCTTIELGFLLSSLETAMAKLGGGVDELQDNLLSRLSAHLGKQGLADCDDALFRPHHCTLQHDPVLRHFAKMRKAAKWGDALLCEICLSRGTVWLLLSILTNAVDFLVDFSPVVIAILTCPWHLKLHSSWVPCANACNLAQATVTLTWQTRAAPASDNTIVTVAPGGSNDVSHLILCKDISHFDFLLKEASDKVH